MESWPKKEEFEIGERNIIHSYLINPNKVLLPLFPFKQRLMKQFVKASKYGKLLLCIFV